MIEIKCITGKSIDINELSFFPGKLKKHSDLEIERVAESILKDGFLFPIGIVKVDEKKYIIDGEARINALKLLEYKGETIPKIPYYRIFYFCLKELLHYYFVDVLSFEITNARVLLFSRLITILRFCWNFYISLG